MKKIGFTKKSFKSVVAVALAAAMAVPATASLTSVKAADDVAAGATATATSAAVTADVKLDFTKGLKEYNTDENLKLEIVKTEDLLVHKNEDEKEVNDKFDANNIMVMIGTTAYYYRATVSNQPSTYVDAERGTVLYMGKTVDIPAVLKPQSAAIADNADATTLLDKEIPVPEGEDKVVQPAMTVQSELKFNSPLAGLTDNYSVGMWINVPKVEGVENALAGKWHHVAATLSGEAATYYVDGTATENTQSAASLAAWASQGYTLSETGYVTGSSIYIGGETTSAALFKDAMDLTLSNAAIMLDDISFFKKALTADEIAAIYAEEAATATPVAIRLGVADFKDISEVDDAVDEEIPGGDYVKKGELITIGSSKETVNGVESNVITVPENTVVAYKTGAFIKNPFAGKNLDGVTISFWVKQDKRSAKNSTGDEETPIISFIDRKKKIENEKSGVKGEGFSMLSLTSSNTTQFLEGFSDDSVGKKLGNKYMYNISEEDRAKFDVKEWRQITLVLSNEGIKPYVNGVLYANNAKDENGKSIAAGPRFCDGYFQRADDEKDIHTKYNIFGGSNNQYATALMDFLTAEDVNIYLGYVPNSGSLNVKTNPTSFTGIRIFETALTQEQVEALVKDNTIYDDKTQVPNEPSDNPDNNDNNNNDNNDNNNSSYSLGDVNEDNKVDLNDAKLVLKAALGISTGSAKYNAALADMNNDKKVDLNDAKLVLRAALGIK